MTDFDVTKVIEGMQPEDAMEFLKRQLSDEAKRAFLAEKQGSYEDDMEKIMKQHLTPRARARAITTVQLKHGIIKGG